MKLVKKILGTLLILFIIAQLFGPERNEGDITTIEPFLAETNPPEDVKLMLKTACFDCGRHRIGQVCACTCACR